MIKTTIKRSDNIRHWVDCLYGFKHIKDQRLTHFASIKLETAVILTSVQTTKRNKSNISLSSNNHRRDIQRKTRLYSSQVCE